MNATPPTTTPTRQTLFTRLAFRIREVSHRPLLDYMMIMSSLALLVMFGLVMVVASSLAVAAEEKHNVWFFAAKQSGLIALGLVAMWVMMRINLQWIKKMQWVIIGIAILLLIWVLIAGVGQQEVGSQSWIVIGGTRFQPSEAAKIALGVFGSALLCDTGPGVRSTRWKFLAYMGVLAAVVILILLQHDLGMSLAVLTMGLFVLLFAGINLWQVGIIVVSVLIALVGVMLAGGFRSDRFTVYFNSLAGHFSDVRNTAYQSYQGFLSLAEGGFSGVGIGQSRAKWFYLPEAQNDYIFSVVGETTGLFGGMIVIVLYSVLLFFGMRCALKQSDRFLALLAATLTCGVVSQAFINIGYVIGLLPVTGIQLPLISSGGTSTVITLAAMGLLASCARHEPEAVAAMASSGVPFMDRIVLLREPKSAGGRAARVVRPRAGQQRTPVPVAAGRGTAQHGTADHQSVAITDDRPRRGRGSEVSRRAAGRHIPPGRRPRPPRQP